MRKFTLLLVLIGLALAGVSCLLAWQLQTGKKLRQELEQCSEELKTSALMSSRLTQLEKQIEQLRRREEELCRQVPSGEKSPLRLMRQLTEAARKARFVNIVFSLKKDNSPLEDGRPDEGPVVVEPGEEDPAMRGVTGQKQPLRPFARGSSGGAAAVKVQPVNLQVEFDGDFKALPAFLSGIDSMERIVKVEVIKVERQKEVFPRQKITLNLVAYTL